MFVVVSGKMNVTVTDEKAPVAELGPGDIFGEMSLLTGARRSATVTAAEAVEALEVNKEALAYVLSRSPRFLPVSWKCSSAASVSWIASRAAPPGA